MSRADKQLRRRKRRQRKEEHSYARAVRHWQGDEAGPPPGGARRVSLSYEITCDPLPGEGAERLSEVLSDADREALYVLASTGDARDAVERIEALLEQIPDAPMLLNWLTLAYTRLGDESNAQRVIRRNFEKNPDYLFARLNLIESALQSGDLSTAELLFGNRFDLQLHYPDRDRFHLTEFRAFNAIAAEYFIRIRDLDAAHDHVELMEAIDPDSDATVRFREVLNTATVLDTIRRMLQAPFRRRRLS